VHAVLPYGINRIARQIHISRPASKTFWNSPLLKRFLDGLKFVQSRLRIKLREKVKPLIVSFQKSMQYKTIEKEDEPQEVNV
jgi:hypothetical protein